jgi:hypothetical protein
MLAIGLSVWADNPIPNIRMAVEQRRNIANASLSGAAVSAPQHALTIFSFAAGLNAEQR